MKFSVVREAGATSGSDFTELASWGWLGVLEAFQCKNSLATAELEAYAVYRMQGAIIDALGNRDPKVQKMASLSRSVTHAIRHLSKANARPPERNEIAAALGMNEAALGDALGEIAERGLARLEIVDGPPTLEGAVRAVRSIRTNVGDAVHQAMPMLPEVQRILLELHLGEDLPLSEAGACIGVDRKEAVELHSEAIHRLRAAIHG